LALVKPHQIMALPNGFRTHRNLHTLETINLIPLDFHEVSQEKLALFPPTMAFIAHYSNPHVVSRLKAQGIPLFITKNIQSIADIHDQLLKIGHCLQCSEEAKLLSIFMEAAFNVIDHFLLLDLFRNSIRSLKQPFLASLTSNFSAISSDMPSKLPGKPAQKCPVFPSKANFEKGLLNQTNDSSLNSKILYLSHYGHFSMPAFNTLTGELLRRLGISQAMFPSEKEWTHAVSTEKIAAYRPNGIIVSISGGSSQKEGLLRKLQLSGKAFLCSPNKVCLVKEEVQQSTSQYAVLAYYDLADAIIQLTQKNHQANLSSNFK
ncbi:MAG: hypothetical protein ACXU9U_05660, partial [Parachlamydiaceae bacterium]